MYTFFTNLFSFVKAHIFWFWLGSSIVIFASIIGVYVHKHNIYPGEKVISINTTDLATIQGFVTDSVQNYQDTCGSDKIFDYLSDKYSLSITERNSLICKFKRYPKKDIPLVLVNYPLKVHSYFWLTEPAIYLEIIAWSLFGLLCSILYHVSEAIRVNGIEGFKPSEVPVHIAKIFYAPICAVVIYFSVNVLTASNDISTEKFNNGSIVLFFILGFFSGRTIELLNKIKDIILPMGKKDDTNASTATSNGLFNLTGTVSYDPNLVVPATSNLANTIIKLWPNEGDANKQSFETNPDASGKYSIKNVPQGYYSISVELKPDHSDAIYTAFDNVTLEKDTVKDIIIKLGSEQV